MTIRLPAETHAALGRVLTAIGVRCIRSGSVTLHFDDNGAFAGWQESINRRVTKAGVAVTEERAQNTA